MQIGDSKEAMGLRASSLGRLTNCCLQQGADTHLTQFLRPASHTVVSVVPILGRAAGLGDELAEGVVLDDVRTEDVKAGVGDSDGGSVARGRGDVGLAADVRGVARDAGVVETEHDGVVVNEGPVVRPKEDATVHNDGAGGKSARELEEGGQAAEDGWVVATEAVLGAQVTTEGRVDVELLQARERVEKWVLVVVRVAAGNGEVEHGSSDGSRSPMLALSSGRSGWRRDLGG
jgi:hypothetical protein